MNAFCDVVLGRVCPILFKFCILESWCDIYVIINIEYVSLQVAQPWTFHRPGYCWFCSATISETKLLKLKFVAIHFEVEIQFEGFHS